VPAAINSTNSYRDWTTALVAVPAAAGTAFSFFLDSRRKSLQTESVDSHNQLNSGNDRSFVGSRPSLSHSGVV
jgi:hypothetical protein